MHTEFFDSTAFPEYKYKNIKKKKLPIVRIIDFF